MSEPQDQTPPTRLPPEDSTAARSTTGVGLNANLLNKLKIRIPGYQLLDVIGRGGQATVYKAIEQSGSQMPVAIKVLHSGPFADPAARERMRREARAMKALIDSPNIVCVFDDGQTPEGIDYLVMNYIDGRPVDEFWKGWKSDGIEPEDPAGQLGLFKKICDAVSLAHRRGITHRDLSPSNILVDDRGEPHILDFGLARTAFDRTAPESHSISVTGQFLGKLAYASPEQALGNPKDVDIRTDVYALGVILYQIVTGGLFPYEVMGTLVDVLNNIIHARPKPPSEALDAKDVVKLQSRRQLRSNHPQPVNEVIEAIVLKALEKNPADRYQSAGDLARDIDSYLAGTPTVARVAPLKSASRRLSGASVVGALAIALVAVVFAVFWFAPRNSTKSSHANAALVSAAMPQPATTQSLESDNPVKAAAAPVSFTTPEIRGGHWRVEGEELVQDQVIRRESDLLFGEPAWSDYDFTFQAMAQRGTHGFKALFHWKDEKNFYVFATGNYFNRGNDLSMQVDGKWDRDANSYKAATIEMDRWYSVRVEVRGADVRCFLDGVEWFRRRDPRFGYFALGRVGLGTYDSAARFRSIRVTSPGGAILFDGVPRIDLASEKARVVLIDPRYLKDDQPAKNAPETREVSPAAENIRKDFEALLQKSDDFIKGGNGSQPHPKFGQGVRKAASDIVGALANEDAKQPFVKELKQIQTELENFEKARPQTAASKSKASELKAMVVRLCSELDAYHPAQSASTR